MLQVMLGLPVEITAKSPHRHKNKGTDANASKDIDQRQHIVQIQDTSTADSVIKPEEKYATLPSEVQAIIYAGKIGRPIKNRKGALKLGRYGPSISPANNTQYQIDEQEMEKEFQADNNLESSFTAPNARLIRNLRRCEFRLLPVLTEWTVVDVAITKYEIVLFEVRKREHEENMMNNQLAHDDNGLMDDSSSPLYKRRVVHDALVATKGKYDKIIIGLVTYLVHDNVSQEGKDCDYVILQLTEK